MKHRHLWFFLMLSLVTALPTTRLAAQDSSVTLVAEPAEVSIIVGTQIALTVTAVDASGDSVEMDIRFAAPREAIRYRNGVLQSYQAGNFEIVATGVLPAEATGTPPTLRIPVDIAWPAIDRVELNASGGGLYVGTTITHAPVALHVDGTRRPEPSFVWSSSNPAVASVDTYGTVTALATGDVTITVEVDGETEAQTTFDVGAFPATELTIEGGADEARTGDVLRFSARARGPEGSLADLPMTWAYTFVPDDSIRSPGASAIVERGA